MIKFASHTLPLNELLPKTLKPKFVKISQVESPKIPQDIADLMTSFNSDEKELFNKCFSLSDKNRQNLLNEKEKKMYDSLISMGLKKDLSDDESASVCYEFVQSQKRENKVNDVLDIVDAQL